MQSAIGAVQNIEDLFSKAAGAFSTKCANEVVPVDLSFYSYPFTFGSTSGPHGGMGGCAMTTYQVYVFAYKYSALYLFYCDGVWKLRPNFKFGYWPE